jgi:phage/plasmid primase-like uncharacterized protein
LQSQALELGLVIGRVPITNGRIQRVPLVDSKPGKRDGAYVIYEDMSGWGGYVQNFKTGQKGTFKDAAAPLTEYQIAEIKKHREEKQSEIEQLQKKTAKRAVNLIKRYKLASANHPYLKKKQIKPHGVLENERGQLAVVLQDAKGHIRSLQFIEPDGRKIYLYGGQKRACFHIIGGLRCLFKTDLENLVICEGFSTGASIYEAVEYTVICAMDCGNIIAVGQALRKEYGDDFKIIIAGDDDHASKNNPGRRFAEEAAQVINAVAVFPEFTVEEKAQGLTDFNDLAQVRGLK